MPIGPIIAWPRPGTTTPEPLGGRGSFSPPDQGADPGRTGAPCPAVGRRWDTSPPRPVVASCPSCLRRGRGRTLFRRFEAADWSIVLVPGVERGGFTAGVVQEESCQMVMSFQHQKDIPSYAHGSCKFSLQRPEGTLTFCAHCTISKSFSPCQSVMLLFR